jgi:hypothetical protein
MIDDRDQLRVRRIRLRKETAAQQWNPHGLQIVAFHRR